MTRAVLACLLGIVVAWSPRNRAAARAEDVLPYVMYGLDFSPYVDGQNPNVNPQVSLEQIQARLDLIAPYTTWVRSFSTTHGLEHVPDVARSKGLKVAAGAWIGRDGAQNGLEIAALIAMGQARKIDMAIVGSEALLRNDVTDAQLVAYLQQVRQAIPADIPVTTADINGVLMAHPNVIAASDVVFANFYPYWEGVKLPNAMCALDGAYQQLVAASVGKPVWISETGWPSDGNTVGAAVPSPANASDYFLSFVSWARAHNVPYFYFEGLDEAWKANYEGPQGAHWGIATKVGALKPGMERVFQNQTVPISCDGLPDGPGTPTIRLRYVPPYFSTSEPLEGDVLHVSTSAHKVAVYIKVGAGYWTKPTFAQPLTPILPDGTWSSFIATGGSDALATEVDAFLVPNGYSPPQLGGATAFPQDLLDHKVAFASASRSPNSIRGRVADTLGNPLTDVLLDGAALGQTSTSASGKYSFPLITGVNPVTVTPTYPNYVFTPSSQTVPPPDGSTVMNFVGRSTVDLTLTQSVPASPIDTHTPFTITAVVGNAAPATASGAVLTIATGSLSLVSIATTRGSCSGSNPITCDLGVLARSATAVITITAMGMTPGTFNVESSLSGPDPEADPSNNTAMSQVTVSPLRAEMQTPAPGSMLTSSPVVFQWTAGSGVTRYWLWVGSTLGGEDIVSQDRGTSLSATVSGLPMDGRALYVRLWSVIGGGWLFRDYQYAAAAPAVITSPTPGSTLSGSTAAFQWTAGAGVTRYWLWVGSTAGGYDLASQDSGTGLSATAAGIPMDGRVLYVRLWSVIGSAWTFRDYQYTAAAPAEMMSPPPGSILSSSTVTFQWTGGKGVTRYWVWVGSTAGGYDLVSQDRGNAVNATVAGLPVDRRVLYVRLWSVIGGVWVFRDYQYTAAARGEVASSVPSRD